MASVNRRHPSLRVALVMGSVSRAAGGVLESARHLARMSTEVPGVSVSVLGLMDRFSELDRTDWAPIEPRALGVVGSRAFGYAPQLAGALAGVDASVVHLHGLWMYTSIAAARWSVRYDRPLMTSTHGMLDAWALANSRWKKRIAAALYERRCLRKAMCLHALCDSEVAAIRAYGLRNPVCVIPNGVAPLASLGLIPPWSRRVSAGSRVLLFLGRLHPKKGLDLVLRAWAEAMPELEGAGWELVIAGSGEERHVSALVALAAGLRNGHRVHFLGPVYGEQKAAALAAADAFVLASHSEGLPMAVLEAWAAGRPVLITPQCNLSEAFAAGAAIRIDPTVPAVVSGLRTMCGMTPDRRSEMGKRGLALVRQRFDWSVSVERLMSVYRWLSGQEPRPTWVIP